MGIPTGQTVHPAFLHQYAAIYTQNDWHATSKLNINLGFRWDWQPAIAERYGRVSTIDLQATNPFGGKGGIYFPDANGNNKRMWDTDWKNLQPRLGFAYRANGATVVRGGAGITFLPGNTGFFDGPFEFGAVSFAPFTKVQPYGSGVQNGIPVGTFDSPAVNVFVPATGANLNAPQIYGGAGGPRISTRDYKNPYVYQGNVHVQQDLTKGWTSDVGYNVEIGKRLGLGTSYSPNSDQLLPDSLLQTWRTNYIARNGTGNTGSDPVPNPFNPGGAIPFAGNLGNATMPLDQTLWAYPYLGPQVLLLNRGFSSYHALQGTIRKELNRGLILGATFTWSKSLGIDGGLTQNNFAGEGTFNTLPNFRDIRANKRLSANDVPIRFASYGVYELPFGAGHALSSKNPLVRGLISGYRLSGTYIWQSGVPIGINLGSALNGLADRTTGAPFELPKSYQHFYDGNTSVVLPFSGRTIKPCNHCFLKYSSDAFAGRTTIGANGSTIRDIYYFGSASLTYGAIRTSPVDNTTMSVERDFKFRERFIANFQMSATNVLNHTQFAPSGYSGGLGGIQTSDNLASGSAVGFGDGTTQYGTHNNNALDPRLIEVQARLRF